MERVVLDSSVIWASSSPSDRHYKTVTSAIAEYQGERGLQGKIAASAISIAEVLAGGLQTAHYENYKSGLLSFIALVIPVDLAIAEEAARIRHISSMKLPDAIIVATAIALDCELWTCDINQAKAAPRARLLLA